MKDQVQAYFDEVPANRKSRIEALHSLILNLFPETIVDMHYKMPTYRCGDGWVAIANQKNYISLYTCGYHHIEGFKTKHPSIKVGKGCINFRDKDPLLLGDIENVVKHAIGNPKPI